MKKMVVTFINGTTTEVPMESRRNFNKTREAILAKKEIVDLGDFVIKVDQIEFIFFKED